MYNAMIPPFFYHLGYFRCSKNSVLHLFITPSLYPLATVSIVLLFPQCHIVGIIKYVAFLGSKLNTLLYDPATVFLSTQNI